MERKQMAEREPATERRQMAERESPTEREQTAEKDRKRFRNLALAQNIVISLAYTLVLFTFVVLWAEVRGVFQTIDTQRQGEIDDVLGWGILAEGMGGIIGGFLVVVVGVVLLVFTVCLILMWLVFWKANRKSRVFSRRRPWGIADQILKVLIGVLGLWSLSGRLKGLLQGGDMEAGGMASILKSAVIFLFFLITGGYLLFMLCRKRKEGSDSASAL